MSKADKITLPAGTKVPDHVAIIMDGNRRWARSRGLDTLEGHRAGFSAAIKLARAAREMGIHTVSLWGFSTENWDRTERELNYLMHLYRLMLKKYLKEAMDEGVRIVHLGRKDRLPKVLIEELAAAEKKTKDFTKHILNICLDHGGRDEIARAVNRYVAVGDKRTMDEKVMLDYLDNAGQPYPYVDLVIRTSGEQRTSGFLLYEAAYAEMYWEIDHLPDFSPEKFKAAIMDYSLRRRRFGGNDKETHLTFDPKILAKLEINWRRELNIAPGERLRDLAIRYVKEAIGLSKDLAKEAGTHFAKALVYRREKDWDKAKEALEGLCEIMIKTLHLAFEPKLVAKIQVNLWKNAGDDAVSLEEVFRHLYAETFRLSNFQMIKAARLKALAKVEMARNQWDKAQEYLEMFYKALKERVA